MRTHFACSQKLPNCKTNTRKVFIAIKRTSLRKIIPIQLCYPAKNAKKTFKAMQINWSTTWQPVKGQLRCSRLLKFLLFSCCYSNKLLIWTMAAKTRFACYQKTSNSKINSTEVFLTIKGTSVWRIIPNGLCNRPQGLKNHFFELRLREFALVALKKLQTAKLTAQKSSWQWKEQVCEKNQPKPTSLLTTKSEKTGWEASRNSPMVTFHFAKLWPFICLPSEPAIAWSGHPLIRLLIQILIRYLNRKIRGHLPQC